MGHEEGGTARIGKAGRGLQLGRLTHKATAVMPTRTPTISPTVKPLKNPNMGLF